MADDRTSVGLSMLLAAIATGAVVEVVSMSTRPEAAAPHAVVGLLAAAALAWFWRARARPCSPMLLARRELMQAVEIAAVMVVDEQDVIRHWSRGCEALFGWTAREAEGQYRKALLHSQPSESDQFLWQQLRREGSLDIDVVHCHRDGRELVIHHAIKLFDHLDGRYSGVNALTDVTEWRKAETALRLSEARLATAVSVQGIFIYEVDLIAGKTIWTTRREAFFGGLGAPSHAPESDFSWCSDCNATVRNIIDEAIATGQDRAHFDFQFPFPDGSDRLAEGWARIIRDEDGRAVRLLGTHLDVTERRAREQALRAGEAERRAILATVPDAMFVCSERGVIRACSATACQLFGYLEAELLGRNMFDLIEDERGEETVRRELMGTTNPDRETPWPLPVGIRRSDGELVPTSFLVGDAMVEGIRMHVVFGRDMRPMIASEERFHRLSNDLAQVSRLGMMGEMAAALAHELSQPLSAIVNFLGAADLMLNADARADVPRLRRALSSASGQASRAGEIIRRLRAFILRGEADMRAERLASLVREAAALALFNTSTFGVRLSYEFENEQRLVLGDRIQIQQVLVNLIRNAADAMAAHAGDRRDLVISTAMTRDNLIEIAVRDSGPGIAAEMLERLFSPFATTKREGLGFGLAISRRIVEAHGGQLSAEPAPDGGAIFRFTLPVMEEVLA
ncbi:PAS domain S-box protein [Rhizorhabdus argentea]|uniref:PAS domain S-box protein n=1 Tax=Rhizorhabdus argentea TaxID=1387174 RepID=UPI0030ED8EF6